MTAEVVIFNKSAIALAADSAVSIEGNKTSKIYNNAEKLFALTKYHPVAIMVYERNELQGVPWEIIIKAFRKQLGSKSFDTLAEYKDAFLTFTREFYFHLPKDRLKIEFNLSVSEIISSTLSEVIDITHDVDDMREIDRYDFAIEKLLDCYKDLPYFAGLDDSTFERYEIDFLQFAIDTLSEEIDTSSFTPQQDKDWMNTCNSFYALCKERLLKQDPFFVGSTGLVFAGYGEQEYFPVAYECEVFGAVGNTIKVLEKRCFSDCNATAGLKAFAQKEEVNTFMEGIGPSTKKLFVEQLHDAMELQYDHIDDLIEKYVPKQQQEAERQRINQSVKERVELVDRTMANHTKHNYIDKIVDMIAHLPKIELANMAESLVNLTAFKRKVSNEIDSVGGPVDVVVISKGDGLVWIKRKHYFPSELNQHYGPCK